MRGVTSPPTCSLIRQQRAHPEQHNFHYTTLGTTLLVVWLLSPALRQNNNQLSLRTLHSNTHGLELHHDSEAPQPNTQGLFNKARELKYTLDAVPATGLLSSLHISLEESRSLLNLDLRSQITGRS